MPTNSPASWSIGLGLLSLAMLFVFWPASPPLALAAIVLGVLGIRASRWHEFGGQGRALVGIGYGGVALFALAALVLVGRML